MPQFRWHDRKHLTTHATSPANTFLVALYIDLILPICDATTSYSAKYGASRCPITPFYNQIYRYI